MAPPRLCNRDGLLGLRLILHTRTHKTVLALHHGRILDWMLRVRAGRQTFDDRVYVGADKVRNGITCSCEALFSGEPVLERRECYAVEIRLEDIYRTSLAPQSKLQDTNHLGSGHTIAPSHENISYVHDDGILERRSLDEVSLPRLDLQSPAVVLEEHGD